MGFGKFLLKRIDGVLNAINDARNNAAAVSPVEEVDDREWFTVTFASLGNSGSGGSVNYLAWSVADAESRFYKDYNSDEYVVTDVC